MEVVEVRRAIATELRKFLSGGAADQAKVAALGRRYGELDGEMSYAYLTAFADVSATLTSEQHNTLLRLRNLDGYTSAPMYIYSDRLPVALTLPDTDHFFFAPAKSSAGR